jgi:hypothetical protein
MLRGVAADRSDQLGAQRQLVDDALTWPEAKLKSYASSASL